MNRFKSTLKQRWSTWSVMGSPVIQPKRVSASPAPQPTWRGKSSQVAGYLISLLSLTAVHGIRYYNEPQLMVGSLAPQTFFAPAATTIEDEEATEAKRAKARDQAPKALQIDADANQAMQEKLQSLLVKIERIRQQVGSLPFAPTDILSPASQTYLRQLPPGDWQELHQRMATPTPYPLIDQNLLPSEQLLTPRERAEQELGQFWQKTYGRTGTIRVEERGRDPYQNLITQIEQAQGRYQKGVAELAALQPALPTLLLDLTHQNWQDFQTLAQRTLYRIQAIGLAEGLPNAVREAGILAQIQDNLPLSWQQQGIQEALQSTLVTCLQGVLTSNLKLDSLQTKAQMEAAVKAVQPEVIVVTKGEVLVRSGETITPEIFLALDHFDFTQRRINGWGLAGVAGLMGSTLVIFIWLQRRFHWQLRRRDQLLVLLLTLTVAPLASAFGIPFSSLPAVGLLVSSFYGTGLGLIVVAGEALLLPLVAPASLGTLGPLVIGSLVACLGAGRLRSREELALLGGVAALTQMVGEGLLSLLTGGGINLGTIALAGGTGLGWSIIALGASPYLERLFDLITPIRLLELANPNRTLLRRLATEAPGTFQHTLFVATLAERAAQRLNLNAELVRTGTLYHDIGKMLHARYFIENQMGGVNPHTQLDDPYRSAAIIKAHVSDGLKLARQYHLPTAIQAFIPEHQGTIRIAYFYHQAQLKANGQAIPDEPFRYDGPIPQTPETGVVMLADACEAALRSMGSIDCLSSESIEQAKATVQRICQARWQDGQLIDSRLQLADLAVIAEAFVEVWWQSNHERIPYPKAVEASAFAPSTTSPGAEPLSPLSPSVSIPGSPSRH
ncbi:MAG: HDIG domain-containing protein [Cyanobacteriota bacterium]|nr:HDIG domain-containing protein [Cyanobacteriota bacterium]